MNTFLKKLITIKRQSYSGTPPKSTYSILGTANAYVRPLTEEQSARNGLQWGKGFFVMVKDEADIQEGDKIVYESEECTVQGVSRHNRGITIPDFKQVLMVRPQKA